MRDFYNNVSPAVSLKFAVMKADTLGDAVDLQGYEGALVIIATGAITDGTHTIELHESDDDSTYTKVDSSDILGTLPAISATDDDKVYRVAYIGKKRYLKVKTVVTGSPSTGGLYGAVVVRGFPRHAPV